MPLFSGLRQNHQPLLSTSGKPVLTRASGLSLQQLQQHVVKQRLYLDMMLGYCPLKSNITTHRYSFISLISSTCPPFNSPSFPVGFNAVVDGSVLNFFLKI